VTPLDHSLVRRSFLAVVVTALTALVPLPARAAADSTYQGGCGFDTARRDLGTTSTSRDQRWRRHRRALLVDDRLRAVLARRQPVAATVTCVIKVNGVPKVTATFDGTVVVAGAKRVSFYVGQYDVVDTCDTVDYTSNDTPTTTVCPEDTTAQIVPQPVYDLVEPAVQSVHDAAHGGVDPTLCPILAGLAPGVPGLVDIDDQGDTHLSGGTVWDCPPDDPPVAIPVPTPPECADGLDNDLDGHTDYPDDPDCWGPEADAEGLQAPPPGLTGSAVPRPCTTVDAVTACASLTPRTTIATYTVYEPALSYPTIYDAELVDYDFALPNGGTVTLPCVVVRNPLPANPCAAAGGTYAGHRLYLSTVVPREPYLPAAVVGVCTADLTVTVNGDGVSSFPAYSIC